MNNKELFIILINDKYYYKNKLFQESYSSYDFAPKLNIVDTCFDFNILKSIKVPEHDRLITNEKQKELFDEIKKIKNKKVFQIKISKNNYEILYYE